MAKKGRKAKKRMKVAKRLIFRQQQQLSNNVNFGKKDDNAVDSQQAQSEDDKDNDNENNGFNYQNLLSMGGDYLEGSMKAEEKEKKAKVKAQKVFENIFVTQSSDDHHDQEDEDDEEEVAAEVDIEKPETEIPINCKTKIDETLEELPKQQQKLGDNRARTLSKILTLLRSVKIDEGKNLQNLDKICSLLTDPRT